MKNEIIRKLDELGRVVIPNEMRALLNLKPGDNIEISVDGEYVKLKRGNAEQNDKQN